MKYLAAAFLVAAFLDGCSSSGSSPTTPPFQGFPVSPDLLNVVSFQDNTPTYGQGPIVLTAIGKTAIIEELLTCPVSPSGAKCALIGINPDVTLSGTCPQVSITGYLDFRTNPTPGLNSPVPGPPGGPTITAIAAGHCTLTVANTSGKSAQIGVTVE